MQTLHPILVVGGGISGITSALELAEAGHSVILLEKDPYLGGRVAQLHNYFPKMCPPACGLEINTRRLRSNPRIQYYTGARVREVAGIAGNFSVRVSLDARTITNRCTACGRCAEVCPIEPDPTTGHKAAYIPGGLAFPMKYTIDPGRCPGSSCAKCAEVCDFDAIHLEAQPAEILLQVHRIIVATGWTPYDAKNLETYDYADSADVITNLELEGMLERARLTGRSLLVPSTGNKPERVAFVQCAGSRDIRHLPYCSAVCCGVSLKQALTLAEKFPGIRTEIFYIDLRLGGRNEATLQKAEDCAGLTLTRGKVGKVTARKEGGLLVEAEDSTSGRMKREVFDLVVLATGMVPATGFPGLKRNEYGFAAADQEEGIHPVALTKRPMDVASSVKDATAAALKSIREEEDHA
ncbi:MAG: FAD-dependent oxidoreductase [Bacteroidales bacterium]